MSNWTHIRGMITVSPFGRTQAEKRYILDTVLEHLPRVTGSEGDMEVHVIQRSGHDMSCSHDEFGMRTNNLINWWTGRTHSREHGYFELIKNEHLKGDLLIFYSYLLDKSKRYGYCIDPYTYKLAEETGKTETAITKLLNRLYRLGLAERLENGKLKINK